MSLQSTESHGHRDDAATGEEQNGWDVTSSDDDDALQDSHAEVARAVEAPVQHYITTRYCAPFYVNYRGETTLIREETRIGSDAELCDRTEDVYANPVPAARLIKRSHGATTRPLYQPFDIDDEAFRASLPKSVVVLKYPPCNAVLFVLGTAHVSHSSVDEAREMVRKINPAIVMIELCASRLRLLHTVLEHADTAVKPAASPPASDGQGASNHPSSVNAAAAPEAPGTDGSEHKTEHSAADTDDRKAAAPSTSNSAPSSSSDSPDHTAQSDPATQAASDSAPPAAAPIAPERKDAPAHAKAARAKEPTPSPLTRLLGYLYDRIATKLDVIPGAEFSAAAEEAQAVGASWVAS